MTHRAAVIHACRVSTPTCDLDGANRAAADSVAALGASADALAQAMQSVGDLDDLIGRLRRMRDGYRRLNANALCGRSIAQPANFAISASDTSKLA